MKNTQISAHDPGGRPEPPATPATDTDATERSEPGRRAIDLTTAQVAGSALAAVIAALIAGRLGVYGTIIGAGVVSVVATTGGPVLQHLFRRTGEEVKNQVQQQVRTPDRAPARPLARTAPPAPPGATAVRGPAADPEATAVLPAADPDRTRLLPTAGAAGTPAGAGERGEPRPPGGRRRGVRRLLLPAVLVFLVALGGITLYEAVSGTNVSGGRGGTTSIGQVLHRDAGPGDRPEQPPADTPDRDGGGAAEPDGADRGGEHATPGDGDPSQPEGHPSDGADQGDPESGDSGATGGSSGGEGGTAPAPTPTPTPGQGGDGGTSGDPDPGATAPAPGQGGVPQPGGAGRDAATPPG